MKRKIKDELTYAVIGCAMKVHNELGSGFPEAVYQKSLAIAMKEHEIPFAREIEMSIFYKGIEIGKRRIDFLVQKTLMLEIKALTKLEDLHLAQGLNYLKAFNLDTGLLLNFGGKSLEVKRLFNKKSGFTRLEG